MTKSLKSKLILSYLAVALITVLVVSVVIRLTSGQSLLSLVVEQQTASLEEAVQTYYQSNGSMIGFFDYYIQNQSDRTEPDNPNLPPPQIRDTRGVQGLVDTENRALLPTFGFKVGEVLPEKMIKDGIPVNVDGETIALILPDTKKQFSLNPQEELFLQRTNLAIGLAAMAGVTLAVLMGFLLAKGLLKPINRLTLASKSLAEGELRQKVPVSSHDELGQLTETFNQMSEDLAHADEQRKRLTADITHDLSTPLQVISGYMEMMEDGNIQMTPERVGVIKNETEHLRRLVGDLTTLTQVETQTLEMQFQLSNPAEMLKHIQQTFIPITSQKNITIDLETEAEVPQILVDEGRTLQVLKNLVENAIRYTRTGGKIVLSAKTANQNVEIAVTDEGEGIEVEDLPFVFERFYRADKTRAANHGKMGLGLAISKALVVAQNGSIEAFSEGKGKGTSIIIRFPTNSDQGQA